MNAADDILGALERILAEAKERRNPIPVYYVPGWQYDLMMVSLRSQGLPATHEDLVREMESVLGPCSIEVIRWA